MTIVIGQVKKDIRIEKSDGELVQSRRDCNH